MHPVKKSNIHFKKYMVEIIFVLAIIAMLAVMGISSKVYATVAYWNIKVGDEVVAVMDTEDDANQVVDNITDKYNKEGAEDVSATIDPALTVEMVEYSTRDEAPEILDVDQATEKILTGNDGKSMVTVTTTMTITEEETIKYKTVTKNDSTLTKGATKVKQEGVNGSKDVTKKVTLENGKRVSEEELSSKVTKEAKDKIVLKGTKVVKKKTPAKKPSGGSSNVSYSGSVSGSAIVNYAMQYKGYRYVYGGETPGRGFDCSGFTKYVYKHFGINLPHGGVAQRSYGRSIGTNIANARPGDLLCFASGHVSIYIGNGKMIHASTPSTGVIITNLSWSGTLVSIRRF